jgi:hypothetical protein
MSSETLILKNPRGWFAAGAEVQKALDLLSDGAFRLFIYLCLNARRDTGVLEGSLTQLAKSVNRAQHTVRLYLREMQTAGICRFRFGKSPLGNGAIEVEEDFWPYQRHTQEAATNDFAEFMSKIRKMLQDRACVKPTASAADEILARDWFDRGIGLECIEWAILIGCVRKYVSWRNNETRTMIVSLKYFAPVLEEVQTMKPDSEYCAYLRYRLMRMENEWKHQRNQSTSKPKEDAGVSGMELS